MSRKDGPKRCEVRSGRLAAAMVLKERLVRKTKVQVQSISCGKKASWWVDEELRVQRVTECRIRCSGGPGPGTGPS